MPRGVKAEAQMADSTTIVGSARKCRAVKGRDCMSVVGRGLPFRVGVGKLTFADPISFPASAFGEHGEPLFPARSSHPKSTKIYEVERQVTDQEPAARLCW